MLYYLKKYAKYFGILILVVILSKINIGKLLQVIYHANSFYIFTAILLNIPLLLLKSYRWNRLLNLQNIQYTPVQSFLIYMSSLYIGFVTPGRLGEFIKAVYLKSDKGISLSKGMSSVLIDRLCDLYLLIFLGLLGIWRFDILGKLSNASLSLVVILVLAPLFLLNKHLMRKFIGLLYDSFIKKKIQFKEKIEERFDDFYSGIDQLINLKLIFSVLLTCLSYSVFFIQCYLITISIGISINFITITLFMAISNLISFIPISISGLGTRDATLIYLFSLIGLKPELAVSYSFLIFIVFFVCGGLMGAVAWWVKPVTIAARSKNTALK